MPVQIASVVFDDNNYGYSTIELGESFLSELVVEIHNPDLSSAPSALSVSVADALGTGDVIFRILNKEVFRIEPDPDGGLDLVTIPVPDLKDGGGNQLLQPGTYTLQVIQGSAMGTADFEIRNAPQSAPELVEADAPPASVPGAVQPTGVRRWVFQDLKPSGLGSWVLPMNPPEMTSPAFSRSLTADSTTASEEQGGQFHVYEDAFTPVEWKFNGPCPTKEMREQLEAFADLDRRWYLHDHRGRAWKVIFQDLELVPRLTTIWNGNYTDEFHDYTATVLVMEREWVEVT